MAETRSKPAAPIAITRSGGAAPSGVGALNLSWAERFVAALVERGVRDACVCSGSRSAPLALAFHRSSIRTHVPLDERAGAYFALGIAKASRRPVAIVTTSGTAAANLYPAIIEAFHARVPLVILTADRPPELRDTGAAQTIDQIKMFGTFALWFHEVGSPAIGPDLLQYVTALGGRAVAEAWGPPAGPVHLNFAFREPLLPEPESLDLASTARQSAPGTHATGAEEGPEPSPPSPRAVARAVRLLRPLRRGLILCGPDDSPTGFAAAIARLSAVTGFPVLADPASQVRYGPHDRARVLGAYDAFLRSPTFAEREVPEVVLQFGAALTSKAYHGYAARHRGALHLLVDAAGGWRNPSRRAREVFRADPAAFATALADSLAPGGDPLPDWSDSFGRADRAARSAIDRHREGTHALSEGTLFPDLLDVVEDGTLLYVGNSMAIRDLDLFAPVSPKQIRVLGNRGANGIDGVISSGLGASAAVDTPTLIVTGDLSFHHDLTGLAALREGRARATIIVINNDGGGIFSLLPIARHGDVFEHYFGTPHGLEFSAAAALYGIPYSRPNSPAELRERSAESLARGETQIIELRTNRDENRLSHQSLWASVIRAVEGVE